MLIVDSHAHVFPQSIENLKFLTPEHVQKIKMYRSLGKSLIEPYSQWVHKLQPKVRFAPPPARSPLDQLGSLLMAPTLLFESNVEDLEEAMAESDVDYALVIAHPPYTSNEYVLEQAKLNPKIVPVVNLSHDQGEVENKLNSYKKAGARAVKIHAAADGSSAKSKHYLEIIESASKLKLPIILHTGKINISPVYKDPEMGRAELFSSWFENFPKVTFVLAHMNFHEPEEVFKIMDRFKNIYTDTSWQPTEVIGEAVRRVGSDRIMFGTDWPIVGKNMKVGRERIEKAEANGLIQSADTKKILGQNANKLFKLVQKAKKDAS